MTILLKNNAVSYLALPVAPTSLSVQVRPGHGVRFPQPEKSTDWFPLALSNEHGEVELLRCTRRIGDVLYVERGTEGTSAKSFSVGDMVDVRLTRLSVLELKSSGPQPTPVDPPNLDVIDVMAMMPYGAEFMGPSNITFRQQITSDISYIYNYHSSSFAQAFSPVEGESSPIYMNNKDIGVACAQGSVCPQILVLATYYEATKDWDITTQISIPIRSCPGGIDPGQTGLFNSMRIQTVSDFLQNESFSSGARWSQILAWGGVPHRDWNFDMGRFSSTNRDQEAEYMKKFIFEFT